jgi:drug/metabolite transporter (DMT)-like permease
VAVYAVAATPVDLRVALATGKGFPDGSLPRVLALIGSGVGSLVLFGGALWSAWVFLRTRHNGRRALSNVVIAVGVLIVAYGGTATFTGASDVLESANLVGVSVMFLGFLLA